SADEDKHTKHRHTVEFSKDNHTRLSQTLTGPVPRSDSHRTTRFENGHREGDLPTYSAVEPGDNP
ncbi:MAG: hypothetical protein K0S40_1868, partial [Actinomycetospora sp.]|nr:hypothetical protein [Actinomycetospora sp.]